MKKRIMFLALASCALAFAGCNGGFKKGEGGMLYKIVDDKGGPSIKEGDFVGLNFIVKTDADSLLANSYENGLPILTVIQKSQFKGDIIAGLSYLSEGDSAIIKINIDSASHGQPRSKSMKGKYVVYTVKVEKVISKGSLSDQVFGGRIMDYQKQITQAIEKAEPQKIQKYITDNKLNVTKADSGLQYVITQQGTGIKPVMGDTVAVNYTGMFLSGKAFESSVRAEAVKHKLPINPMNPYKPFRFPLEQGHMIKGWIIGIPLLNKGTKATLILPSKLAYGAQGSQNGATQILPFTPLVFEVELVDVIHPDPNAPKPVQMVPPTQQPIRR